MRILHIVTGMAKASGVSVFAGELASQQAADGHRVAVLVKGRCAAEYPVSSAVDMFGAESPRERSTDSACSARQRLSPDVVHVHALWDPWLTWMARRYRPLGAKIVWSPHGMLTPWALKNHWPKKLAGLLAYQYWSLRAADLIHVTADTEAADVRRLGLGNRLVLAPLGVHVPDVVHNERTAPYICFVSRIQRKKGLPNLLRAWALLPADLKRGWRIKIAGPDEDNHLAELCTLCEELQIPYARFDTEPQRHKDRQSEIEFLGPVYGAAKDALYANAAASVLPTHSENFGSVVIESLAQGTPVICTKGAPWKELVECNCGWWIDIGVEPLVRALTEVLRLAAPTPRSPTSDSRLSLMGANGRRLVRERYTWPMVAEKLYGAIR